MGSMLRLFIIACVLLFTVNLASAYVFAATETKPEQPSCACRDAELMDNARLDAIIRKLDVDAEGRPGFWRFMVAKREVLVITDENANRMRIISGVVEIKEIDAERLQRLMQANFDTALDARYAIAQGVLWSAFLHPLSTLHERDFISGIAQVVNLAVTYGSTYSSGAITFGGGDSGALIQELLERADSI